MLEGATEITVTGSSSRMLSTDIATEFRGRAVDFELLPMSFREVAGMRGLLPTDSVGTFATQQALKLSNAFDEYLHHGGFPAVQGLPDALAIPLLQSYAQRVVATDVVERHGISRPRVATAFTRRVLGTNGKQLSVRKTENVLRSMGLNTSRETLADLLTYLEDACLVFQVREFSKALSDSTTSLPKIYAIDPGLALANTNAHVREDGQRLEDAVYLELRRRISGSRRGAISSYRTAEHGWEVDFVVGDEAEEQPCELYQVTVDMADETTFQRETRALWEAMDEAHLDCGTLIVGSGESKTLERESKRIDIVPAWKWVLE